VNISNETGQKQDKQDIKIRGHKGVNGAIDIAEKKGDIKGTNGTSKKTGLYETFMGHMGHSRCFIPKYYVQI